MPELAVVIPTKNRLHYLRDALASIPEGVEIIVVDDGSTDGTRDAIPCIPNRGKGVSAARNTGIAAATAPLVGFLDDDDVWLPGHVEVHLRAHQEHPEIVASYSQGRMANADLEPYGPPRPTAMPENVGISAILQPTGSMVVKRDSLVRFDELLTDTEDLDFVERLALKGAFWPIPVVTTLWRQHPRAAGGYSAWASRYRQSRAVLSRSLTRSSDRRARFQRRVRCRGWAVHDGLNEAERCLAESRTKDARLLLVRVWTVSPLHTAKMLRRYLHLTRQLR